MLYRRRAEGLAKIRQVALPRIPVVAQHANLDELMGGDGPARFLYHRFAQALGADHDHGFEGVGLGFQEFSLFRSEFPRFSAGRFSHIAPKK